MAKDPWYKDGLRFKCTGCGKCCTGPKGYIWISVEEIQPLAEQLKISPEEFIETYTNRPTAADIAPYPNKEALACKYLLKEIPSNSSPRNYDCIFLSKEGLCSIYNHRPKQCRTYPFWPDILRSESTWRREKRYCEGIEHHEAPIIAFASIEKDLNEQKVYENEGFPTHLCEYES